MFVMPVHASPNSDSFRVMLARPTAPCRPIKVRPEIKLEFDPSWKLGQLSSLREAKKIEPATLLNMRLYPDDVPVRSLGAAIPPNPGL